EGLWKIQALSLDPNSLFFAQEGTDEASPLPQETSWEQLNREYRTQGYSIVHHPMKILRPVIERWSAREKARGHTGFSKAYQLDELKNGSRVRIAGLLSVQQRPPTAKGFAFLTVEDETGLMNIVLKPDVYTRHRLI